MILFDLLECWLSVIKLTNFAYDLRKGVNMEQMHSNQSMPLIVQLYPSTVDSKIENPQILHLSHPPLATGDPSKLSYQQAVTSESLTVPSSDYDDHRHHTQMLMTCQQTQLQRLQTVPLPTQVIPTEVPTLQFGSHFLMPQLPMHKQHHDVEAQAQEAYLGQYDNYMKEKSYVTENGDKSNQQTVKEQRECDQDSTGQPVVQSKSQRKRSMVSNPSTWACNVRKIKHQSGEAYISRRGKFVPERKIKSTKDCLTNCKFKCNKKITDTDRELIFKAFYSLSSNEKKHFLLNTTERHEVRQPKIADGNSKRLNTFKYYFLVRGTRHAICKNFYLGTLSISQKPVYNVHAGKSELNIPKPDGRGLSPASYHGLPASIKDTVRKHIMSFLTVDSAPIKQFSKKQQHLAGNFTIKQMYNMYLADCGSKHFYAVKQSMYRKILKQEFNIHFAKTKVDQLCAKCKEPIKRKGSEVTN